jgi:hypothetical protein
MYEVGMALWFMAIMIVVIFVIIPSSETSAPPPEIKEGIIDGKIEDTVFLGSVTACVIDGGDGKRYIASNERPCVLEDGQSVLFKETYAGSNYASIIGTIDPSLCNNNKCDIDDLAVAVTP